MLSPVIRLQVGFFGVLLGCAGVPIYLHLPRFASADLGISLTLVGLILIGIRVMDFAQDPFLGRLVDSLPGERSMLVQISCIGMAVGFLVVFSWPLSAAPAVGLTIGLIVLLTSYSLATILLYGFGREFSGAQLREVSVHREIGIVAGIIIGATTPSVLGNFVGLENRFHAFGLTIAGLSLIAAITTKSIGKLQSRQGVTDRQVLDFDAKIRNLVLLALVNSLPVAVTSTLFLFFVEDALLRADLGGVFLAAFFLSAALTVPFWSRVSAKIGIKNTLTISMSLAIASFAGAALLTPSTAHFFWIICVASGAAIGADMILLPVLFTSVLVRQNQPAGQAFGLWFLASKLSLAGAAVAVLPLLDLAGFRPGETNSGPALGALIVLYAVIPSVLKFFALVMVRSLPTEVYTK